MLMAVPGYVCVPWALWLQNTEHVCMKIRARTHQADLKELARTKADRSNTSCHMSPDKKVALQYNAKTATGQQLTTRMRVRFPPAWEQAAHRDHGFIIQKTVAEKRLTSTLK